MVSNFVKPSHDAVCQSENSDADIVVGLCGTPNTPATVIGAAFERNGRLLAKWRRHVQGKLYFLLKLCLNPDCK